MNEIKYIARKRKPIKNPLYIGANNTLVEEEGKALTFGSELMCKFLIESFIEHTIYEVKDFEIIKIRKGEE